MFEALEMMHYYSAARVLWKGGRRYGLRPPRILLAFVGVHAPALHSLPVFFPDSDVGFRTPNIYRTHSPSPQLFTSLLALASFFPSFRSSALATSSGVGAVALGVVVVAVLLGHAPVALALAKLLTSD